jgi:hypothetical protein
MRMIFNMIFNMPHGGTLRIESSENDTFLLFWGDDQVPFRCSSEKQAYALALGIQWAAKKTMEKLGDK